MMPGLPLSHLRRVALICSTFVLVLLILKNHGGIDDDIIFGRNSKHPWTELLSMMDSSRSDNGELQSAMTITNKLDHEFNFLVYKDPLDQVLVFLMLR